MKKLILILMMLLLISMPIMAKTEVLFYTHPSISVEGLEPGEYEQKVINEYEALNPDVDIILEVIPYLGDQGKVQMSIAAGTPPDIYATDIGKVKSYANAGLLADWDNVLNKSDFKDFAVEASSIDGKMYYFPIGLRASANMFSMTLAEKVGIADMFPMEGKRIISLELFEDMAKKANESDYPNEAYIVYTNFMDTVSWHMWFAMYIGSFGGQLFNKNEEGKFECVINSPESKEGIEYYLGLWKRYPKVMPKNPETIDIYALDDSMKTGKMITCPGSINQVILERQGNPYALVDGEPGNWVLFAFPTKEGVKPIVAGDWCGFVVFDNSDEKVKASQDFVKYFVENAPDLAGANYNTPPVYNKVPIPNSFKQYEGDPELDYCLNVLPEFAANSKDFGFDSPVISQLKDLFVSHMQGVFIGAITVDECLKRVEDKANELLKEYYE